MTRPYLTLLKQLAGEKEREVGRELTLDEQNAVKDAAMHAALISTSQAVAQERKSPRPPA